MYYSIISEHDRLTPDPSLTSVKGRNYHERLRELQRQGRLLLAGICPAGDCPDPELTGIRHHLVIAEFDSMENAEDWAKQSLGFPESSCRALRIQPFQLQWPL